MAGRKLFLTHASELAHLLVTAITRDAMSMKFVRAYAQRHDRRKVVVNTERLREMESTIGRELFRARHSYRDSGPELQLIFFQAHVDQGAVLQNLVFEGFEWADSSTLTKYDFLRADREFVALLASQAIPLDTPS